MGRNKLIHSWSTLPCAHRTRAWLYCNTTAYPAQGSWPYLCTPVGSSTAVDMGYGGPAPWFRCWCGWVVPGQSPASAACLWQIPSFSCLLSVCSQTLSSYLVCVFMQRQSIRSLQAVFSILKTSVHEWFICTSGSELDRHKKHWKSCNPDAFSYDLIVFYGNTWHSEHCLVSFKLYTCPEARTCGLSWNWLPSTLNVAFLQQLSFICRISVQFHGIQAVSLTNSYAHFHAISASWRCDGLLISSSWTFWW